jgi:CDGSH-type Zn-finger protein
VHTVEIKSTENGPNLVYLDGKVFTALCRCGGSGNKPFCDGTHAKNGFHAKPADLKVLAEHSKVEA